MANISASTTVLRDRCEIRNLNTTPEGRKRRLKIISLREEHPEWIQAQIAKETDCTAQHVMNVLRDAGVARCAVPLPKPPKLCKHCNQINLEKRKYCSEICRQAGHYKRYPDIFSLIPCKICNKIVKIRKSWAKNSARWGRRLTYCSKQHYYEGKRLGWSN